MSDTRVVCSACGSVNRLPPQRKASDAKCGRCGERLFAGQPREVDGATLDRHVTRGTLPVLVDVWAPWCGPCRTMAPAFAASATELEPAVLLLKLNSDQEQATASRLGIRGIPTMILFRNGTEIARSSGAMTASQIVSWTRSWLQPATG